MNAKTWTRTHALPDNDLVERLARRAFSPAYKLRILREVDECSNPSEVGALLRRERLYLSHLAHWRAQHEGGSLRAPSERSAPAAPRAPQEEELADLRRRMDRVEGELDRARGSGSVQGRVSALLRRGGGRR